MKQTLHYNVDPFDPTGHRLKIQLRMPKPKGRTQLVCLPSWIPGSYLIRDFSRHVETMRAWCGKKSILPRKLDASRWALDGCDGPLTIEIIVYAWDLSVREAHFDESHAFFQRHQRLSLARGLGSFAVHGSYWGAPAPSEVAGLHEHASQAKQRLERGVLGHFTAPNYDAVIDHPFELGTPQVVTFRARGALHEMVFTGGRPGVGFKADCQRHATHLRGANRPV